MERKSRMFEGLRTWNPWFGCEHHCYNNGCWAYKRLAHRLGKGNKCSLCYDFKPHLHPKRLTRVPPEPKIFVVAHGDLFGRWVPNDIIEKILSVCRATPKELWFFETKNPKRHIDFLGTFPTNTVLSTTIETNRIYSSIVRGFTPFPTERFEAMLEIKQYTKYPIHIAIEPIMEFDLDILVSWMKDLEPLKVAVGYDSLNNNLLEPPKWKTLKLIEELEKFTDVERKQL